MASKHHLHVAASIPDDLTPDDIIAALHDHTNALTLQSLTTGHVKAPETLRETLKDTYWLPHDQYPIETYHVTEVITFIPGVGDWAKKNITFPSCFQDTPKGLKTRADASGVIVRAEFRVVKGGAGAEVDGEGMGIGDAEWVLVEDVEVSCSWWLMPFVRGKMEQAHQDICRKLVEKAEMQKRQETIMQSSAKGKRRVDTGPLPPDEYINTGFTQMQREHYAKPSKEIEAGAVEVDAVETERAEAVPSQPEKIRYR